MKYKKLGEILIGEGFITPEQLSKALDIQRKEGGRIGEILIKLKYVGEDLLAKALSRQLEIPYISYSSGLLKPSPDQNLEELLPKDLAVKNLVLPLSRTLNTLTCAMFDPLDLILIDNLRKITGCEINPVIATKSDILKGIEEFYGRIELLKQAVEQTYAAPQDMETPTIELKGEELSLEKLVAQAEEAPVVKLVDLIISQAIEDNASDIHIEAMQDRIRVRYRIDGVLYEIPSPAKHLYLPIVSRIKILSKMDIAEKRLPQDGGFVVKKEGRLIDLRVSTIPTIYGEKVVLRILDKGRIPLDLGKLGFLKEELELIRKAINSPWGLVFLTGPTGSGKTTTLYACLNEIKSSRKNILTVEDPVEYRLEGINQVQVKPDIGLTFARALRAFLRQDPDIILVGEVRDLETAEICVRASLTGHLVLSTLHTNDAPSAVTRLIDIGLPPYLVSASLLCVVAQRLVRKLCPKCKEPYEPKEQELAGISLNKDVIYKAKGCEECKNIGYRGRTLISEIILADEELKEYISKDSSLQEIRNLSRKKGMKTLLENGIIRVEEGVTSLEEVLSVAV